MPTLSRFAAGVAYKILGISVLISLLFVAGCTTSGNSEAQLSVTTLSGALPAGSVSVGGGTYPSTTLVATGGTAPYMWTVTSGALPPGLALSTAGVISGSPTASGTFNFTVTVTDSAAHTATGNLSITINATLAITTTGTLPATGEVGGAFSATLVETGGVGPFTWTLNSGSLPTGLTLSSAGVIGTTISSTAVAGTFNFTAKVTDSQGNVVISGTISIKVDPALVITPPTLASGLVNVSYTSAAFVASGGSLSGYTFAVASGSLPSPLTIGASTGIISGTPAATGTSTFAIKVTDSLGFTATTSNLTITINAPPAITSASSTSFTTGTAGTFTVTTAGFPAPALTETGALPSGVTFVNNGNGTATLAGTPAATSGGTYSFTVTANNGIGANATQTFTLTVDQSLLISSATSATFTAGTAGTFAVTTSGFPTPTTLTETGALPSGVTFVNNGNGTATLAGTPSATSGGTYPLTITAHNGVATDATQSFTLTVDQALAITSGASTTFTTGSAGTFTVTATGFPKPALGETGALPGGVTFTDNGNGTATIAGTPAAGSGGTYTLTVTASDGGVETNATQTFTLTVDAGSGITSLNSTTFTVGTAGTFAVTTSGFPVATTLSETGSLPNGVTFVNNGNGTATLAGTPAAGTGGTYALTITAGNGIGSNVMQSFTLTVDQALAITSATSTTFTAGTAGTFAVTTTGFPKAALSETGALPGGVTFTDNGNGTATLAGTAAAASGGTYTFTITASNGVETNATQTFTLTVDAAPAITSANITSFTVGSAGTFAVVTTGFPKAALGETGALPGGVTFTDNGNGTATLAGMPAAASGGTYPLTITANNGIAPNATQTFTLTVDQALAITSGNSTTFTAGTAGTFGITTTGFPKAGLSETGALPSGVTFTDNGNGTATLAGTAAGNSGGIYTFTITASNGVETNATQTFTLTVDQGPAITSSNSASFVLTIPGSFTVVTSGFPKPTLSETGALPGGVTFIDNGNGTATLAGTPTGSPNTYPLTITAQNGVGLITQNFTLTVTATPVAPIITSATTTTFSVGTLGSFTVTATGTPSPTLAENGTLPSGVTFNTSTGALSGTPAAGTGGTYSLTFTASNGQLPNATQTFTLTVDQALAITSGNSTTFTAGTAGTFGIATTGFPKPALGETGVLPSGVTFTDNGNGTATLAGTPAANSGGTYAFTITANDGGVETNATQTFTLTVNQALAITNGSSTTFAVGTAGTFAVTTTGFPKPALSETGALPGGVTFTDNGNGTATLAGTPAAASGGTYTLTITANDGGVETNATQTFTLKVNQALAITSGNSTTFTTGTAGTFTVTTSGFPTATTLSETGSLPNGVTFVNNGNGTATLAGTPAANSGGTYSFTITANDGGVETNSTQTFTLTVNQALAITSVNNTTFMVGAPGTFGVTTTGFPKPALSETGALPSGVTFTDNGNGTATLVGTPAVASGGTYTLTITANDGGVETNATQTFTLTVGQSLAITSANNTTFTVGTSGTFGVTTTGFPKPALSETGALPSGVTFTDNGNGAATLSGTPAAGSGGTYSLTITANDGGVETNATQTFTLTVHQAPAITSSNSASFAVNSSISFTVMTSGYPTPALGETGALPSGVTFTDNGNGTATISGPAPATTGSFPITFTATNGVGSPAMQSFTLSVVGSCTTNCQISGQVTGPWVEFVTITLNTGAHTTTDVNGNYSFTGLTGGTTYTVTPSLTGYKYTPSAPSFTLNSNTVQDFTAMSVVSSFSISGFVSYPGTHTGTTLINVYPCAGCNQVGGTTLTTAPAPGGTAYTVRGLSAGNYIVNAEIDTLGTGVYNASDPEGGYTGNGGTVSITTSNATGVNFAISDRTPPSGTALVAPTIQGVAPSSGTAFIIYKPFQDSFGEEVGTSYKIYYGTDTGASNLGSVTFAAGNAQQVYVLYGLTNGTQYYFQMSAINSSGESTPKSSIFGPVTIGNSTAGTDTVSGTVTFSGITPTGPLTVGLYSSGGIYFQSIPKASLSSPQAFTISGVPAGSYQIFTVLDQNANGVIDAGDITNFNGANGPPSFAVSGSSSGNAIVLAAAPATTFVTTNHTLFSGVNTYGINVGINGGTKLPVSMTMFSGPNVAVPFDMAAATNNNDFSPIFTNSVSPTVGDTYQFLVTFSDGTSQVVSSAVNAVLTSFVNNMAMNSTVVGTATVPVLNWTAPTTPPAAVPYTYSVGLNSTTGTSVNWNYNGGHDSNGLPSTTTNVAYNVDGSANPNSPLVAGATYDWQVTVQDANDNTAQLVMTYTVPGGGPATMPPVVTTSFSPSGIAVNVQTTMTFTVSNPNASQSLSQVGFSDTLNGGLHVVSAGTNTCGGTPTGVTAGSTSVGISGVSLPATGGVIQNGECTFRIVVSSASPGTISNSATNVTSFEGGAGSSVAGSVTVVNIGAPTITGLSTNSGPVGLELTITGTNFESSQQPVAGTFSSVSVNGAAVATSGYATWSNTSIQIFVPAGAATGNVVVNVLGVSSATGPASAFTITAGSPAQLVFLTQPSNAAAGSSLGPVEVAVEDLAGNINPTWNTAINLIINLPNPGNGTLSGTTSIVPTNGVATFTNLSINNLATGYELVANSTGLLGAGSSSFNITGTPASVSVTVPGPVIFSAATPQAVTVSITVANDVAGDTLSTSLLAGTVACSLPSSTTCGQMPTTATFVSLSAGTGTYSLSYTPPTSANLTATTTFTLTVSSSLSSSLAATASFNVYPAGTRVVTVTGLGTQRIVTGTSAPANRAAVVYNDTGATTGATLLLMASGSACPVVSSANICGTLTTGTVTTGTTTTGTTGIPFTTIPFTYTAPSTVPNEPYDRPMILAISNANPAAVGQINFEIMTGPATTNMVIAIGSRLDSALTSVAVPLTASLAGDTGADKTAVWTLAANGVPCEAPCSNAAGTLGTPSYTRNGNGVTPAVTYTPPATVPSSPDNTPTITVTSVDNPTATDSFSFAIVNGTCGSGNESVLNGQYAFLLKGGAASNGYNAFIGSITANGVNGNGLITSGLEDINRTTGVLTDLTLTGTYSVGSDNRGCMTLTNSNGGTATFRFALGTLSGGVATQGTMSIFNDNSGEGVRAEGILLQQNSSAFNVGSFKGTYVFGRDGADAAGGRFSIAGLTTSDGVDNLSNISLDYDDAIAGPVNLPGPGSGSFGVPTPSGGRATFITTIPTGTSSTLTDHFVAYIVSPSEILSMSTDPADSTHPIQSGENKLQTGTFSTSELNSSGYVLYVSGVDNSNGGSDTSIGQVEFGASANGVPTQLTLDENDNGIEQTEEVALGTAAGTFSMAATGKMTITGGGSHNPIFYMVDSTQGFIVGTDGAVSGGYIQKQTASSFSTSSISGQYFAGGGAPTTGGTYDVAEATFVPGTPSGTLAGTDDSAGPNYVNQGCSGNCGGGLNPNSPLGGNGGSQLTYSFSATSTVPGQGNIGGVGGNLAYIISPTKLIFMQMGGTTQMNSNPAEIYIVQQ